MLHIRGVAPHITAALLIVWHIIVCSERHAKRFPARGTRPGFEMSNRTSLFMDLVNLGEEERLSY